MGAGLDSPVSLDLEEERKMIRYGLSAVTVSLIWFFVRGYLGMPDDIPLFHEGIFLFGDRLAVVLGIAGAILAIIGVARFFREA